VRQYKLKKFKRAYGIHFAPDGARLLAVGGSTVDLVEYAVWLDLTTGASVDRIDRDASCYAVDPLLTRYVLGAADGLDEGAEIVSVLWTVPGDDPEWRTFRPAGRKEPPAFEQVTALALDPAGQQLAISHSPSDRNWALTLVHRDTGKALAEAFVGNMNSPYMVLAFSADGTRIAGTGGMDGDPIVQVFDTKSGRELHTFEAPGARTRSVLILPDTRLVVANGRNVHVAEEGATQFTLTGHTGQVNALALAPDGQRILSASHDGGIRVWDANTGEAGPAFDWGIGPVTALAFAPDGLTCAAAGLNGKIVVWDVDG
jgi:WD40 repeat protein